MQFVALTTTSDSSTVTATAAGLGGALFVRQLYLFTASTNCWIRQGTSKLLTCVAKASLADTDFITVALPTGTKVYEFDVAGNGVTAGRVQVNVSTDTTAATVAARLRTALLANQATLEVTDNTDGTLTIVAPDAVMVLTETVANAGFTVAVAVVPTTAADGSMYVPAGFAVAVSGDQGPQLGVLRDAADGKASLTRCLRA
jgi:hypothetical protein